MDEEPIEVTAEMEAAGEAIIDEFYGQVGAAYMADRFISP